MLEWDQILPLQMFALNKLVNNIVKLNVTIIIHTYVKNAIFLFPVLAPSEISQPTSSVTDENNVVITWDTPENENGVLLYYEVNIYNQLSNYSEIIRLMPDALKSVSFDDLGKLPSYAYLMNCVSNLQKIS